MRLYVHGELCFQVTDDEVAHGCGEKGWKENLREFRWKEVYLGALVSKLLGRTVMRVKTVHTFSPTSFKGD